MWVLDKDGAALTRRTEELCALGMYAKPCIADLTRAEEVAAAIADIHREVPALDVLVNNAGADPRRKFVEMTEEEWQKTIDINLNSAYRCTRLVVPGMISSGRGRIVHISSVTFHCGLSDLSHYVAAKGGLIGFTRALARELGPHNIHVNCITPGAILTEREAQIATKEEAAAVVDLQSLKRRLVPLDVARACVFLSTDSSDGITGQTINVDGGWVMH